MISKVYAMASPPNGAQGQSPIFSLGLLVVPFLIIYLMMIRPQKKKELHHKKFVENLKKGDEVVTQSGIFGRVAGVSESVVTLEVANNVKIRVAKNTVASYLTTQESAKQESGK